MPEQQAVPELIPPTGNDPLSDEQPIGFTVKPPRRRSLIKDKVTVVRDIIKTYNDDKMDRQDWVEARIQRTAKYRGWREKKMIPWEDASNAHLPIIMTDVQRTEDTLHNAVLSTHPVMNAKAVGKHDSGKEETIDQLIDHQVFIENRGEERIGNLISSFTQDGQYVAYIPYIKEKQKATRTYLVDYPPAGIDWTSYLLEIIGEYYPQCNIQPGKDEWSFKLREVNELNGKVVTYNISAFESDSGEQVQIICHHEEVVFDGPAIVPIELEDIVVPTRSENLQPRTMANPTGALHVTMVDYPTVDEVRRLIDTGFYDEVSDEDYDRLDTITSSVPQRENADPQAQKKLQDDLTGTQVDVHANAEMATCTRLTYFGRADLDGDGLEEEVVYWLIEELDLLLRCRYLTEVYPVSPMRRPFAMSKYIPVNGQFYAIGLIELMESGYDIIKKTFDQMTDSGDLTNTPWGFYRPMSGIRPEKIRVGPGDLYPTNDPKNDVHYPVMNQGMSTFGQNTIALVSQILDQVTLVGQLQLGGVPAGKSAALRTTSNMQALLQQGDARPERVLRRFFTGLADIWSQFHELNGIFLPAKKMFRIMRGATRDKNPYIQIENKSQIKGRFLFSFTASILNTNKALAQSALQDMSAMLINPLMLQLGISTPETIYNLTCDIVKAKGQDVERYIRPPQGVDDSGGPVLAAEDVVLCIVNGMYPHGKPMEPLPEHLAKLQEIVSDQKNMELLEDWQQKVLAQYVAIKVQEMQQMLQQQQLMQNADQFAQGNQSPGMPGPKPQTTPPNMGAGGNPQVQGRELLDESLPGAGGGK